MPRVWAYLTKWSNVWWKTFSSTKNSISVAKKSFFFLLEISVKLVEMNWLIDFIESTSKKFLLRCSECLKISQDLRVSDIFERIFLRNCTRNKMDRIFWCIYDLMRSVDTLFPLQVRFRRSYMPVRTTLFWYWLTYFKILTILDIFWASSVQILE